MRVPAALSRAFDDRFEALIGDFLTERKLIESTESLRSPRYLSRSIIPHILKLSERFNRLESKKAAAEQDEERDAEERRAFKGHRPKPDQSRGLDAYWGKGSNPENLRLAYFLYFMPSNLFRVASVWGELHRLGYRWTLPGPFKGIEFGSGPATAACGIAAGEKFAPCGLPEEGNWALLEQDGPILEMGARWTERFFPFCDRMNWSTRQFKRKLGFDQPLLPKTAPKFHLWTMSFFLNESQEQPSLWARRLLEAWDRHLEEDGLAILVEPALKDQSRRILELRRELIEQGASRGYQVLLPCLGHQACGALAKADDWCHEDVTWWRPPYFKKIDEMASLDRKSLPFSYLVIAKSKKSREELLPALAKSPSEKTYRLVSPAHREGPDLEFYLCGQDGKRKTRLREPDRENEEDETGRGDILLDAVVRGDEKASRVDSVRDRITN